MTAVMRAGVQVSASARPFSVGSHKHTAVATTASTTAPRKGSATPSGHRLASRKSRQPTAACTEATRIWTSSCVANWLAGWKQQALRDVA
eukprot:scaffold2910_cov390-Prasinococcus_capsulatus_cf.AAC.9